MSCFKWLSSNLIAVFALWIKVSFCAKLLSDVAGVTIFWP